MLSGVCVGPAGNLLPPLLCLVTVPASQLLVAWSTGPYFIFAGVLTYLAVCLVDFPLVATPKAILRVVLAFVCCWAAVALYQPPAMLFWVFAAIKLSDQELSFSQFFRLFLTCLVVMFFAIGFDIVGFEWAKSYFGTQNLLPGRSKITTNFLAKLPWFFNYPFVDSLNFLSLRESHNVAWRNGLFLVVAPFVYLKGTPWERTFKFLVYIGLIFLAYLPNFAIAENFSTYRTQIALSCLLMFYALLALKKLSTAAHLNESVFTTAAFSLAAASALFAYSTVLNFFAIPQELELKLIRQQIRGDYGKAMQKRPLFFTRDESLAPFVRYDEFGMPSSAQIWARKPMQFLLESECKSAGTSAK